MQNIPDRRRPESRPKTSGTGCRKLLGVLLLLFSASALRAQEAPKQALQIKTLDSILVAVRDNNPMLQGYDYKIKAMSAYAEGAKSWMAPMIGAGTFMTPYPGQNVMSDGDKGMFMLAAEQAIPNPAKLRVKESYIESRAAIEAAGQSYTYNQLRAQAKSLYYEWVVLEKKKAVLEESRQIMETMLKLARIRYPYSQGSLGSIYKAEGRLHEVENMILKTRSSIVEKNIRLNAVMNIARDSRYGIDTNVQDPAPVLAAAAADTTYLLQNRSDLLRMERTIESMQLGVELERMERKPEFSLRFEHILPYGTMMPSQYTLMGMISIPIAPWSSKMYKSNIKGMRLEIQAMKKERQAMLNEAQGMISGMTWDIQTLRQQLGNYGEKIIPALQKNYEATLLAYEQNQGELPMVIDAWEALNMARMEELDKLKEYYLMIVEYEKQVEK